MVLLLPVVIAILAFVFLPVLVVIVISFTSSASFTFPPPGYSLGYYQKFLASGEWLAALRNSLLIATCSTALTLALVTPAAFGLNRYAFFGRNVVNLLLMAPLMIPHIALCPNRRRIAS